MKIKFKKILLICSITAMMLCACGQKNNEDTHNDKNPNTDNGQIRSAKDIIAERKGKKEPTDYRSSGHKRYSTDGTIWFDKKGLRLTPCGDFDLVIGGGSRDNPNTCKANVQIKETTDGCEDGFKNVIGVLAVKNEAFSGSFWFSAFDKYNGISFEVTNTATSYGNPDKDLKTIPIGDEMVPLSIEFKTDYDDEYEYCIITVTCPVEYDGTIFQYGYYDPSMRTDDIDFESDTLYIIDETPFYGDGLYNYFAYVR